MTTLTRAQKIAVELYAEGDFGHFTSMEEVEEQERQKELGDSLFLFIMRELEDAGDDAIEGARMLRSAAEQLEQLADSVDADFQEPGDGA